jgi:hypothetical protein
MNDFKRKKAEKALRRALFENGITLATAPV